MNSFLTFLTHTAERLEEGIESSMVSLQVNIQQKCQQKSLMQFINQSAQMISSKMKKDVGDFERNFDAWNLPPQSRRHRTENDRYPLQEDNSVKSSKVSRLENNNSRICSIQSEKKAVMRQIRLLNEQIAEIKNQQKAYSLTKRRQSLEEEEQANEAAKRLVNHFKKERKERQLKKRLETQKMLQILKEEEEIFREQVIEQERRLKDQKRRQISMRIEDTRNKRCQREIIDRESNKIVAELKRQQKILLQNESLPQDILEIQQKKMSICQKKQEIDFKQIQEHERKYIANKVSKDLQKRGLSTGHPGPKFVKNMWSSILQNQDKKKKEEQQEKEREPKKVLDRRLKYGELVKSIFVSSKTRPRLATSRQRQEITENNASNGDLLILPKISESQKIINETKLMRKYREKNRVETSPGHLKSYHHKLQQKDKSPQEREQQKQREMRLLKLKRQTDQRLKRLDTQIHQVATPEKAPKNRYKNYLGTVKLKKKERNKEWKKIIENTSLTEDQKRVKMLKHAESLEQEAKRKEQTRSEAVEQQSINLYINSIQAKLALLQNF